MTSTRILTEKTFCSNYLRNFIKVLGVETSWNHQLAVKQPTYESYCGKYYSTIDHFMLSMSEPYVTDDPLNRSNHIPAHLVLNIGKINVNDFNGNSGDKLHSINYEWERATRAQIKEYTESLLNILGSIKLSEDFVLCEDELCSCELHKFQIDEMCSKIVCACLDASVDIIPINAHNKKNNENKVKVPFWKEIAQPYRENAIFWHNIWCDNGKPHEGLFANIRWSTRALYNKAIRDVCNNEKILKRQRMAECITKSDSRNLWVELKKVKQSSNGIITNSLDGASHNKEIANSLGNKYNT